VNAKTEQPQPRKAVGIWIRVSTEDQAHGDSPEHHEKRARYYAESRGWEVKEVYHLEAVSGKSVMEHAETQRMLKDLRRGHISGLIFSKLARLARNTKELLEFADIFRGLNADLISLQEAIDTSSPAGRLFYTMIAAMAQWEREEIAERVSASVIVRAKMGKPMNGKVSFGYQWKDKKVVIHPDEAPIRKLIYELYLEHRRKKTVARILNQRGYRTREGKLFSDMSVDCLLRDPTAKGMHRANYTTNKRGKGLLRVVKPESDWVWTKVEPIVTEEVWSQCNRILGEVGQKWQRRGRLPVTLFAGYVYCHCGTRMYVRTTGSKYVCQKCWNKIPVMDLEAIYYEQLKGFFLSPTEIADQISKADDQLRAKEELLKTLDAEQAKLQAEIDRVYRLYVDEQLTGEAFARFYKPLEARQKQLSDELPRLQAEIDVSKINNLSADRILAEAKDLYDRWPSLNRDEKRKIVDSITDKIVIGKGEIAISLCYLPSSGETTKEQSSL
jgi:site-specific DNA recombinase